MKYTREDIISTIIDASTSCDGYWWNGGIRIPFFDFSTYNGSPVSYSNHMVMLDILKPYGVEPAAISCNGGPIYTMVVSTVDDMPVNKYVVEKLPAELIDCIIKYLNAYNDYPVLDDRHYETDTVEFFEERAFKGSDLTEHFDSWDEAGYALREYDDFFNGTGYLDPQFPLSAEENGTILGEFEAYMELHTTLFEMTNVEPSMALMKYISTITTNDFDWNAIQAVVEDDDEV